MGSTKAYNVVNNVVAHSRFVSKLSKINSFMEKIKWIFAFGTPFLHSIPRNEFYLMF